LGGNSWSGGEVSWNLDAVSHVVGAKVQYLNVLLYTPISVLTSFALGLLGFGVAMAYTIDPNRFSLHAVYRDRLIRAYLGASKQTARSESIHRLRPK